MQFHSAMEKPPFSNPSLYRLHGTKNFTQEGEEAGLLFIILPIQAGFKEFISMQRTQQRHP